MHDLLIDVDNLRTRYLDVRLAKEIAATPGDRDVLVPIGTAQVVDGTDNVVRVPLTRGAHRAAPRSTITHLTRMHELEVRRHFSLGEAAAAAVTGAMADATTAHLLRRRGLRRPPVLRPARVRAHRRRARGPPSGERPVTDRPVTDRRLPTVARRPRARRSRVCPATRDADRALADRVVMIATSARATARSASRSSATRRRRAQARRRRAATRSSSGGRSTRRESSLNCSGEYWYD